MVIFKKNIFLGRVKKRFCKTHLSDPCRKGCASPLIWSDSATLFSLVNLFRFPYPLLAKLPPPPPPPFPVWRLADIIFQHFSPRFKISKMSLSLEIFKDFSSLDLRKAFDFQDTSTRQFSYYWPTPRCSSWKTGEFWVSRILFGSGCCILTWKGIWRIESQHGIALKASYLFFSSDLDLRWFCLYSVQCTYSIYSWSQSYFRDYLQNKKFTLSQTKYFEIITFHSSVIYKSILSMNF